MRKLISFFIIVGISLLSYNYFITFKESQTPETLNRLYFEKLAHKYYGDRTYGRYLQQINQNANRETLLNEQQLIVPEKWAIIRFYSENGASLAPSVPIAENSSESVFRSSMFHPVIGIIIVVSLIIGYMMGRKTQDGFLKKRKNNSRINSRHLESKTDFNDFSSYQTRDEFIIAFNKQR